MKRASGFAVAAAVVVLAGSALFLNAVQPSPRTCGEASVIAAQGGSIAGYSGDQLLNAEAIMDAASSLGLDRHAQLLGVMTAMGESSLRVLTYGDYETSGVTNPDGTPTTSIGLFQQQEWWGSVDERLDPTRSATLFFQRLVRIDGWQTLPPSEAIHRVQINSDPSHYAKWAEPAAEVTAALSAPCAAAAGDRTP